jgi:hypothetical protein
MARIASKRIDTTDLQGEGSYILLKPVSYKVAKEARYFMIVGDVKGRVDMTDDQKDAHMKRESELTEEMIFNSVIGWNWQDENGVDLPLPRKSEDLDLLTADEVGFIVTSITSMGQGNDAKN